MEDVKLRLLGMEPAKRLEVMSMLANSLEGASHEELSRAREIINPTPKVDPKVAELQSLELELKEAEASTTSDRLIRIIAAKNKIYKLQQG